jgi:DNA polymerase III subunit beta
MSTQVDSAQVEMIEEPKVKTPFVVADPNQTESAKDLLKKITWLMQSISSNPVVPILENLLFEKGVIYSNNLQVAQVILTPIRGTFLFPAKELQKILKELDKDDMVSFEGDSSVDINKVRLLVNGKVAFTYCVENPSEFPKIAKCEEIVAEFTGPNDFKLIHGLKKYVSTDALRPAMTCIHVDEENIAATNGNWLVYKDHKETIFHSFVPLMITAKVADIIKDFTHGTVKVFRYNGAVSSMAIKENTRGVVFNYVDEKYPDYKNVIPENSNIKLSLNKKNLVKHLKLAMLAANKTTYQIVLSLSYGSLVTRIKAEDLDFEREYVADFWSDLSWTSPRKRNEEGMFVDGDLPNAGDPFAIGFNAKFLLSIVEDIDQETIVLEMTAPNRGVIINKEFLLMPVMISNYGDNS